MEDKEKDKKVIKLKEKKSYKEIISSIGMDKLIIIAICGIVLVILSVPGKSSNKNKGTITTETTMEATKTISSDTYVLAQEEKLKSILRKVKGVGEVDVMITLKDAGEKVVLKEMPYSKTQQNDKDSTGGTSEKSEYTSEEVVIYEKDSNGVMIPYVVKNNNPSIEGVVVVAKGGDNANVELKITEIVEALFNISSHKISVIGMSN